MSSRITSYTWELQVNVSISVVFNIINHHPSRYEDVESVEGGSGDWHFLFTSCLELTVEVDFIIIIIKS